MLSNQPEFKKLLLLHGRDRRHAKLKSEIDYLPIEQTQIENQIKVEAESIEKALLEWKNLESKNNSLEGELLSLSQQISRLKTKQLEVKKNEEYTALENEINSTLKKQNEVEDQQLETLMSIDDARKVAEIAETKIKDKIDLLKGQLSEKVSKVEECKADLLKLEQEIQNARGEVELEILSKYDRTKSMITKPPYLAPVEDQKCTGCNLRVSNDIISSILVERKITNCDQCGRIVYVER